ncbi:MAG: uracil-DNA glycosylase family protein [Bacteroidales bacterium]
MTSFADRVIKFNKELSFEGSLPDGIKVMNPFRENPQALSITRSFYKKYYEDNKTRKIILGINPGRFGAGLTGIPFTDSKRLAEVCGIETGLEKSHEPSSVFIYKMIERYGGSEKFYSDYFINSVCPLGFLRKSEKGNWINCNYYDYKALFDSLREFIVISLEQQLSFGLDSEICFVLGKKNALFLKDINEKEKLFGSLVILDHPRYIEQYKSKYRDKYISGYLSKLNQG